MTLCRGSYVLQGITGKDKVLGKGPAEKTGRKIDNTLDDIKK